MSKKPKEIEPPPSEREKLGERIARAIEPEAWAEVDAADKARGKEKGKVTNGTAWKFQASIEAAKRVLLELERDNTLKTRPAAKTEDGATPDNKPST